MVPKPRSPAMDFFVSMIQKRDCEGGGGGGGARGSERHPYGAPGHHEGSMLDGVGSELQLILDLTGISQPRPCEKSIGAGC